MLSQTEWITAITGMRIDGVIDHLPYPHPSQPQAENCPSAFPYVFGSEWLPETAPFCSIPVRRTCTYVVAVAPPGVGDHQSNFSTLAPLHDALESAICAVGEDIGHEIRFNIQVGSVELANVPFWGIVATLAIEPLM